MRGRLLRRGAQGSLLAIWAMLAIVAMPAACDAAASVVGAAGSVAADTGPVGSAVASVTSPFLAPAASNVGVASGAPRSTQAVRVVSAGSVRTAAVGAPLAVLAVAMVLAAVRRPVRSRPRLASWSLRVASRSGAPPRGPPHLLGLHRAPASAVRATAGLAPATVPRRSHAHHRQLAR